MLKECFSRLTVSNNFEELLIEYSIQYNVNFSLSSYCRCANTCNECYAILLVCNFAAVCSLTSVLYCVNVFMYILFYCTFFFHLIWALLEINVID